MATISFPKAEACTVVWRDGGSDSPANFTLASALTFAEALGDAVVRITRDRDGAVLIDSAPVLRHTTGLVSFA